MFVRWLTLALGTAPMVPLAMAADTPKGTFWGGFDEIEQIFSCGASVDWIGRPFAEHSVTSNGPNHVQYIGAVHNATIHRLAYPGAVTNPSYVTPLDVSALPAIVNWPEQIREAIYRFKLAEEKGIANANNTLFFFTASNTGNDILGSVNTLKMGLNANRMMATIRRQINTMRGRFSDVYEAGVRNYVFFSVLPVQYTPVFNVMPTIVQLVVGNYVKWYQEALVELVKELRNHEKYKKEVTIFAPDITETVRKIAEGTLTTGPTAGYLDRKGFCAAYQLLGTLSRPNHNAVSKGCYPARKYLFHDQIHFTSPAHCEYAMNTLKELGSDVKPPGCIYA